MNKPTISYDERYCLRQMAIGNKQAFTLVYNRYRDVVFRNVMKYVHCYHFAEDVTQEIFARLWQVRERFVEMERFENYLFRMAKNHCLNFIKLSNYKRLGKDLCELIPENSESNVEETVLFNELQNVYRKALQSLTPMQKKVVDLVENGYRLKEVAKIACIAKNTAVIHRVNAHKRIRSFVEGHYLVHLTKEAGVRA